MKPPQDRGGGASGGGRWGGRLPQTWIRSATTAYAPSPV